MNISIGDGFFPFLSIVPETIIAVLINTLVLFLVIKHFLFDRVNAVLDERKNDVQKSIDQTEEALENAKELEAEYTSKLATAKEESAEIIKNATKKAQSRYDEIVSEAKDESVSIVNRANADIEKEKKRAVNQIKDEISDIALSIAEKVVTKEIDSTTHEKLIEEFIEEM